MKDSKTLPSNCPACGSVLVVERLVCPSCRTSIEGGFSLPVLVRLLPEEHDLLMSLLQSSGSLKEMARRYGVSYPTIRNRLDALIEKVTALESEGLSEKER